MLARLHLEPDEALKLQDELGKILDHFLALATVDTDGIPPMTHAVPMDLRLRDDEPGPSLPVRARVRRELTRVASRSSSKVNSTVSTRWL